MPIVFGVMNETNNLLSCIPKYTEVVAMQSIFIPLVVGVLTLPGFSKVHVVEARRDAAILDQKTKELQTQTKTEAVAVGQTTKEIQTRASSVSPGDKLIKELGKTLMSAGGDDQDSSTKRHKHKSKKREKSHKRKEKQLRKIPPRIVNNTVAEDEPPPPVGNQNAPSNVNHPTNSSGTDLNKFVTNMTWNEQMFNDVNQPETEDDLILKNIEDENLVLEHKPKSDSKQGGQGGQGGQERSKSSMENEQRKWKKGRKKHPGKMYRDYG